MPTNNAQGPIGTLSRGLHLLACVARLGGHVPLARLTKEARLHMGTVHRLAGTLVDLGYLERDEDGRYSLGVHVIDLGFAYLASLDVRTHALPELERLRSDLNCAVGLVVLDGTDVVYVERLESKSLQPTLRIGVGGRLPAYATSSGKAILAFLPPEQQQALLERMRFESHTSKTVQSRTQLLAELQTTKRRGYAISDQEHFDGYRAAAAPVFNRHGEVTAAILAGAVVGSFATMRDLREIVAPRVLEAAQGVSRRLGWAG